MSTSDNSTPPAGNNLPEAAGHTGRGNGALPVVFPLGLPSAGSRPGGPPPAVLSSTPNAPALLKALRRRWVLAATLGILVGAAVAAGVWVFLPPGKHTAYVKLYMPSHPVKVLFDLDAGADFGNFQRTQLALLKGRMVLNTALANPKVRQLNLDPVRKNISAVEWLEKEIKVEFPDGPELPRVTMTGDDPDQIKILVTAVVEAYLEQVVNKEKKQRQDRIAQLKEILIDPVSGYETRLKKVQDRRDELAKAVGVGSDKVLIIKQELREKQLGLAQGELIKVEADLRRMKLEARIYQKRDDPADEIAGPGVERPEKTTPARDGLTVEVPDKLIDAYIDKDLEREVAARTELETRLARDLKILEDENNPTIRQLRAAIDQKNAVLEEQRKKLRPRYKAQLQEKMQNDAKAQLSLLNEQIKFNSELKDLLEKEVERLQGDSKQLNAKAIDIDGFRMEIKQLEDGVSRVKNEIDKVTVELPAPARVNQQEETVVIAPDEASRKLRMAGLGAGIGFGLVLMLVAFLEFRTQRLNSPDDVVLGLGLDLMGTLPAAPRRFGGRLIHSAASDAADWQALLAESVDSARTLLLRAGGALRVVMVTSATSGEGKTSLATHLAASLARAGHKTLLLDGDLRKPTAHRIFDLPQGPGFSEMLRGQVDLPGAVRPTQAPGLWLLPAGSCDDEAVQLLAQDVVRKVIERLRPEYDYIVIDSSPVLPVADSLLLAQYADGVLLSLFQEVSRLPKVYLAYQRLKMIRVRMLGAVMNGTHEDIYGYGQRYAKPQGTLVSPP